MPTYAPDLALQRSALLLVEREYGGVIKRAAVALDLDYIMFRRFLAKGRSKPENRQKVRDAVQAAMSGVAKGHELSHDIPVEVTRSMLTQLLEALDAYQIKTIASAPKADR